MGNTFTDQVNRLKKEEAKARAEFSLALEELIVGSRAAKEILDNGCRITATSAYQFARYTEAFNKLGAQLGLIDRTVRNGKPEDGVVDMLKVTWKGSHPS